MTSDTIELRLPLKSEYLPVLRAVIGVVAGTASFKYDDIIQLRVAASEAFDIATRHAAQKEGPSEVTELTVRFAVTLDKIEILIIGPKDYGSHLDREHGEESRELLKSLVDEVEFATDRGSLRIVKYKSA